MNKEPKEPPPKEQDSLEKLAAFTKAIMRVPKEALNDKADSPSTRTPRTTPT